MNDRSLRISRLIASIAATIISLGCGSNYVYSAWAPQFADRLKLSSTEANIIGLAGNLGMYSCGIPVGMVVDKNPRAPVLFGSILLALGYSSLRSAFVAGKGSVPLLCISNFATGLGGCMAFAAAVKISALNWPHHRGTATAFPLGAFGLSAFFFSLFSQFVFAGDDVHGTENFLLLLAFGSSGMIFVSFFALRVIPQLAYSTIPQDSLTRINSNPLTRTSSQERKASSSREVVEPDSDAGRSEHEGSSLISECSNCENMVEDFSDQGHSYADIRGLKMLAHPQFYGLFALMGILTGIGLMTINNIGNDATALWRRFDDSVSPGFLTKRQAMHVSIISVFSFLGRLVSGVGSDLLVKRHLSRSWCFVIASGIFCIAQICAINIANPYHLFYVSSLTGLAYGILFGVFPSVVAEVFGVGGLSQNWGCITLAPVVSGNLFNLFYGSVFDSHSVIMPGGERQCDNGVFCYQKAYFVTLGAGLIGLIVSLYMIRQTHPANDMNGKSREIGDHAA